VPKTEAIAEQNVVEVPLYTYLDVARYLRVPFWVAFSLSGRHRFHPEEVFDYFLHGPIFAERIADDYGFPLRDGESKRVSFHTLVNVFVLSFLFRNPLLMERHARWHPKDSRILFDFTWNAFRLAESEPGLFADQDPDTILNRFERSAIRFMGWDRNEIKKLIALHFDRVERKDNVPIRLYPFTRDPALEVPRFVVIDPEVRFGRPTVKGVPTDVLTDRWRAGDNSTSLAEDYCLTTDGVDEAIRYESTPYTHPFFFPFFGW
jgi:uncharacterized protein (DUF433 family)